MVVATLRLGRHGHSGILAAKEKLDNGQMGVEKTYRW